MRLTSIFRLPKYKTFNYIPRYYDAKKEQEEKRKKELLELVEAEKQKKFTEENQVNQLNNIKKDYADSYENSYDSDYQRTISSAFNKKEKEKIAVNTNQLLIMGVLVVSCVLFWNFGTQGILFAVAGVIWIVFRMRMKKK